MPKSYTSRIIDLNYIKLTVMVLRKTSMSIVLLCCAFFISSCSSDEQNIMTNAETCISQEEMAMKALIDSIDVLNEKYPSVQEVHLLLVALLGLLMLQVGQLGQE